jgi:hypothetical protein
MASASRPEPVSEILVARPVSSVDASAGPAASSAEPVVNFELPSGCSESYETNDVCKTVQALVDARTRLNNRACAPRFQRLLPEYSISCEWQRYVHMPIYGESKDCYVARYDGEGIVCTFWDPQHARDYDGSFPYEAVQKALTSCLSTWKYEETSNAKAYADRAFSLSKVVEDGPGKNVTRVQACLFTKAPRGLDEQPEKIVQIEVFTERLARTADGGTR